MPIPATFEAYYDCERKHFWIRDDRMSWVALSIDALRLKLKTLGVGWKPSKTTGVSEIDRYIASLYTEKNVFYAGPMAGHKSGLIEQHGNRILVTNSPKIMEPVKGAWPLFKKFLDQLLGDPTYPQADYFHGWLLFGRQCLISEDYKPGQCLVLAGPPDCGKSFLQNRITTLLGGRAAKPYQYMAHDTNFNRELFAAEHLMIEDVISSTDIRARRNFGSRIKEFTVNEVQACHGKNRDGINVNPLWRMSITVNDEPEDLMVLPPMIDSVADKFILLRASKAEFPAETETFLAMLEHELPAYLWWLHNEWKMPEALKARRYGIASFQHPYLLNCLNDLSPEHELWMLINRHCFQDGATLWKGNSARLQDCLSETCKGRSEHLFKWSQACGTYLGRLAKQFPTRIIQSRTKHDRIWTILAGDKVDEPINE